jgi:poly [ADP-ribose] polymerase 6/8
MSRSEDDDVARDEGADPEAFISSEDDFLLELPPAFETSVLDAALAQLEAVLPRFEFAVQSPIRFKIRIPSLVLPTSLAVVNQFDLDPVLLELVFEIHNNSFEEATMISLVHPIFGANFPGRPLLLSKFNSFFRQSYHPKSRYRSALYVLEPSGIADAAKVKALVQSGFWEEIASRALVLTRGDVRAAIEYLLTGTTTAPPPDPIFRYAECPLLYLILELVDGFLDLTDHCCIGGEPLGISCLKPSNCGRKLCVFGMANLGVGSSVVTELRRDPMAADFLVSIASAASGTKFFVPPLPKAIEPHAAAFFTKLPAISTLAQFGSDRELREGIGPQFFEILRYILFTNRCHLIHLPPELAIRECRDATEQFLCVVATPERELTFQNKKKKSGTVWLWHGSALDRWHSILHNGLRDLGGTGDARHGGPGDGVYQSNMSTVSLAYADMAAGPANANKYGQTRLPAHMTVLALCENVKSHALTNKGGCEYTQKDVNGLIVRCIMVAKSQFNWDPFAFPPAHVPSLHECLSYIARRGS